MAADGHSQFHIMKIFIITELNAKSTRTDLSLQYSTQRVLSRMEESAQDGWPVYHTQTYACKQFSISN